MGVHFVTIGLFHKDTITGGLFTKDGSPISKFEERTTKVTSRPREFTTEHRIVADSGIASSTGNPTINAYLEAEDDLGFKLAHMDQYIIVTQD